MQFSADLSDNAKRRIEACDLLLHNAQRLRALQRTGLMGSPQEQAFDRLAHLAARILNVPLTIVSLVSDTKQFFKAAFGLPAAMEATREIPIDGSICRYTLAGEPIIVEDASVDPLLMHHPATVPWGIVAFIAIPMVTHDGQVLGAFCAVDNVRHTWTPYEIYVLQELTASVMAEVRLREQVSALESERELRERFVMALTHDLRTPLTAAKMIAEVLARKTRDVPAVQTAVTRICDNLERTDRMIRDLLDISRVKAGQELAVHLRECDLRQIVQQTLADFTSVHGPRFVETASCTAVAWCDPSAFRRILENLLGNAVKYGAANQAISVHLAADKGHTLLSVHNGGEPISAVDQVALFDPYYRAQSARRDTQRGWGIGLTLVRSLVEAHRGTAWVVSTASEGTTFFIRVPTETPTPGRSEPAATLPRDGRHGT